MRGETDQNPANPVLRSNQCTNATFVDTDVTRTYVDVNLQPTSALEYLSSGPATFRECVRTRPVLALQDNGFTQAVIDRTGSFLAAGLSYNDSRVFEICRHHFNRCFMFYDADPTGDGSSPVVGGSAAYNLTITYHGQTFDYPVRLGHCGQLGYHDWLRGSSADLQRCFLNETVMAGQEFSTVLQHAEDPHTPTIALLGRYAYANYLVCNKQQHVCNSIPEYMSSLTDGCRSVVPKCRAALKHLHLMMMRDDPDEQQCNNFALKSMRG